MHKLNSIMEYNLSLFLIFSSSVHMLSRSGPLFSFGLFSIYMKKKKKKKWMITDRPNTYSHNQAQMHTCTRGNKERFKSTL